MGYEHTKPTMRFHYQNIDQSLEMAATVFFFFNYVNRRNYFTFLNAFSFNGTQDVVTFYKQY